MKTLDSNKVVIYSFSVAVLGTTAEQAKEINGFESMRRLDCHVYPLSPNSVMWHKMLSVISLIFGLFVSNLDSKKVFVRSSHLKHKITPPPKLDLINHPPHASF